MYIELESGAELKLANNSNTLNRTGELVVNQGTTMVLNDISFRGTYTGATTANIGIEIDGTGSPNTFKWGVTDYWPPTYSPTGVAITGDWQTLGTTGIEIKFNATTGHGLGNIFILSFDGTESYPIRIGTGFHSSYINGATIFGEGSINSNDVNQVPKSVHAKNLSSSILVHGRVSNTLIYGVTMKNGNRSVMAYGDNDGTYGNAGVVVGGTNYECKDLKIIGTNTLNNFSTGSKGSGILIGHPEHRGSIRGVTINLNNVQSYGTNIEPNFGLRDYEVRNNVCNNIAAYQIHCWRESQNGLVLNNNSNCQISSPSGWFNTNKYGKASNYAIIAL
jgi:hypothetical protein